MYTHTGSSTAKNVKPFLLAEKVMVTVFWDSHQIILTDFLENGKTINNEQFAVMLENTLENCKSNTRI